MDEMHTTHAYRIGFGNYNAFFAAWMKRGFFTRRRLLIWLGMTLVMLFLSVGLSMYAQSILGKPHGHPLEVSRGFWMAVIAGIIVSSLLCSAVIVYLLSLSLIYVLQLAGFLLGNIRRRTQGVALSAPHITKTVDDVARETPWSQVHDIVAMKQTLLIFTSRNSAMVIPKSAFETPENADRFVAAAQHFWTEATGGLDAKKHPEAHF